MLCYFSQWCLSFVVSCYSALLKSSALHFNTISNVQMFRWGFVRVYKTENRISPYTCLWVFVFTYSAFQVRGCLHIICLLATFPEVWRLGTVSIIFPVNTKICHFGPVFSSVCPGKVEWAANLCQRNVVCVLRGLFKDVLTGLLFT